ncbi:MAG: hypothetical protein K9N47_20125 [Prosthecobacter sp.]|uniref:hypothetical protein n=1 Tax=Prosthecobacter sp. TaxID=1965333 RepID=UPI00263394B0|nr:hypothetical protein [Prosthecobacter sp.]MCF7788439.1 hypothetical protein [Prosthecobacter sp.]
MSIRLLTALALLSCGCMASAQTPKPSVWISPPGQDKCLAFRQLFEQPDAWKETRVVTDVLFITDLNLQRHFSDEELRKWFGMMKAWKLKLAMEVGAVKPWAQTGEKCFNAERKNWERLQSLGANLYAIAMDEPLVCAREQIHRSDEYAMKETAAYVALVRQHFPDVLIGDIEAYPSAPIEEHQKWIKGLQQQLAEKKVRGLDFYRLDVDWLRFNVQQKGSWKEVRQLELFCRQKKLPFSLIYWASGYPGMQNRGLADDSTWYTSIMQQGYDYAAVDGRPDQIVIESWVSAPSQCLPETGDWTFTRSVLDFVKKFVK